MATLEENPISASRLLDTVTVANATRSLPTNDSTSQNWSKKYKDRR